MSEHSVFGRAPLSAGSASAGRPAGTISPPGAEIPRRARPSESPSGGFRAVLGRLSGQSSNPAAGKRLEGSGSVGEQGLKLPSEPRSSSSEGGAPHGLVRGETDIGSRWVHSEPEREATRDAGIEATNELDAERGEDDVRDELELDAIDPAWRAIAAEWPTAASSPGATGLGASATGDLGMLRGTVPEGALELVRSIRVGRNGSRSLIQLELAGDGSPLAVELESDGQRSVHVTLPRSVQAQGLAERLQRHFEKRGISVEFEWHDV